MLSNLNAKIQKHPRRKLIIIIIIFALVMLMLVGMRIFQSILLRKETKANIIPIVSLIEASRAPTKIEVVLPGTVLAWHGVPIYARTNGYIKNWYVDIGSKVKTGDLLAEIETPELDAQLRQAEAELSVAIAENILAQSTAKRWVNLHKTDSVSQQATDEKVDTAKAAAATVVSRRANRDRLQQLVEFERVLAPFDGVISDRRTDIGALINIGSSPSEQQPLFRMVQINPLRLYVKIPQSYASRVKPSMSISLRFAEHPGIVFQGQLIETAHAINPKTRTLLAQFKVENKAGLLLPGSYTTVSFSVPSYPESVRLPVNTLIFQKEGLQVATISKESKVVLKKIRIHNDFGNYVEIVSGIEPGELIIINPSDSIYTGQQVRKSSSKVLL